MVARKVPINKAHAMTYRNLTVLLRTSCSASPVGEGVVTLVDIAAQAVACVLRHEHLPVSGRQNKNFSR
jgi:hypothetical protein